MAPTPLREFGRQAPVAFYVIGLFSLLTLLVLAFSSLSIQKNVTGDLAFITDEGNVLADATAPWLATFFFAAATINLLSTNFRILNWVSRLTADSLKVSFLGESQFWSESKIYPTVMRIMVPVGSVIILTGIEPVGLADHRFFRRRVREGPLLDDAHRA